jgi:hypothetical protein
MIPWQQSHLFIQTPGSSSSSQFCIMLLFYWISSPDIPNTDINQPSREITFPHYIAPSPNQSARIPVLHCVLVHGHVSLKNPECFVVKDGGGFRFGDMVVLGGHGIWEVVVECIEDVGKNMCFMVFMRWGLLQLIVPWQLTWLCHSCSFDQPSLGISYKRCWLVFLAAFILWRILERCLRQEAGWKRWNWHRWSLALVFCFGWKGVVISVICHQT